MGFANFTAAIHTKGYLFVRVNAYEAKENRENLLASTDTLDLFIQGGRQIEYTESVTNDTIGITDNGRSAQFDNDIYVNQTC